jgi:alpha-L-fucosidase
MWLRINGEAIYGTRPWTRSEEGHIHYTVKAGALYAIMTNWPGEKVTMACLTEANLGRVHAVTLLGHDGDLIFSQTAQGLTVTLPAEQPCKYAWALKITTKR